jgi:hypothetical protein
VTSINDGLKLFAMTSQLIEHDLDRVELEQGIDLERDHKRTLSVDQTYYPQIETEIRAEASAMAPHYEVFYSLETTIRRYIRDSLEDAIGPTWLASNVPDPVRTNAEKAQKKERDAGITPRSSEPIDFTTFGELSEIIKANWNVFEPTFQSIEAA